MIDEILNQIQTMTPALILTLGLAVGLQHAFEPDHVVAISSIISKEKNLKKKPNLEPSGVWVIQLLYFLQESSY